MQYLADVASPNDEDVLVVAGFAHTIRLPEDLLDTYDELKRALGLRTSHADVIRLLFGVAETAIQSLIQSSLLQFVVDSKAGFSGEEVMLEDPGDCDAADDPSEVAEDSDPELDVQAEDSRGNVYPDS
ncbi:hypothetical protein R1sor_019893 [Riccia sorocarpa]|uniref:Uncharacterized protein n=1 Tax=Riccia sorocarpa TaxID=122646 RepID=A0ABD3IEG8_9MARC